MNDSILKTGSDVFVVAVPFVGLLLMGIFRLDTILAAPKQAAGLRRPPSGTDKHGRVLLSDPDGRPWKDVY